jgi:hypothetical protein
MARPIGPSAGKPFRDALRLVMNESRNNPRKMRRLAEKLYDLAVNGDVHAIALIADRTDGKPMQGIGQDADLGALTVRWLDPQDAVNSVIKGSIDATAPSTDDNPTEH